MSTKKKTLSIALQGGGAHGAFTWGVLDRFLDEKNLEIEGYVGTSAGAMNAAVLAYGLHAGGRELAKELLHKFWKKTSDYAKRFPYQPSFLDNFFGREGNMDFSPGFVMGEIVNMFVSPYQTNPMDYNPLREILLDIIDFESLRKCTITKLFVCATNVRKGKARVFRLKDISVDAVLASANLPFLFKAVTIDGEDYWDGGYMGNPPIFPLIEETDCPDVLVVQINPINIPNTPTTSHEIKDRINELCFNSSLVLEMQKIELIDRMLKKGIDLSEIDPSYRMIYVHNINPEEDIHDLNLSSKLNASWDFLSGLRDLGRKHADKWLNKNFDKIGVESTTNLREVFM